MEHESGDGRIQPTRAVVFGQRKLRKDLAIRNSTVVIASGDLGEERFSTRCKVVKGHFYITADNGKRLYNLNDKKEAIFYAATVRFISSDLITQNSNRKVFYLLPKQEHLDIVDALDRF